LDVSATKCLGLAAGLSPGDRKRGDYSAGLRLRNEIKRCQNIASLKLDVVRHRFQRQEAFLVFYTMAPGNVLAFVFEQKPLQRRNFPCVR
jgi:hypothetical protein